MKIKTLSFAMQKMQNRGYNTKEPAIRELL